MNMAVYLIKLNLALMLLYGFYRFSCNRDTFFMLRRVTLLGIYLLSTVIPLVSFEYWVNGHEAPASMAQSYAEVLLPTLHVSSEGAALFSWQQALLVFYVVGCVFFLLRMFWQLGTIVLVACRSERTSFEGIPVRLLRGSAAPFSFFGWIFVDREAQSKVQLREILIHELTHVRQWHSADVMLAELFTVVCWFNPFAWLMKREVKMNLEYLADEHVLAAGSERMAYQYHLLGLSYRMNVATLFNNFNVLPLKQRIKMMNKHRTNGLGRAKYLLFIPLAASLLIVSNIESVARGLVGNEAAMPKVAGSTSSLEVKTMPVVAGRPDGAISLQSPKGKIYDVVEELPGFPGGVGAMMDFLAKNIKYPVDAQRANKEGRVIVVFVVEKDGMISSARIARSVYPSLDAEALRVVKAMPKWTPGKQKGKPVRVKFNIPVLFQLTASSQKTKRHVP